jgi:hypothetical protein
MNKQERLSELSDLRRVARAAKALVDGLDKNKVLSAQAKRYAVHGSGGQHFITNARLDNLIRALEILDRKPSS